MIVSQRTWYLALVKGRSPTEEPMFAVTLPDKVGRPQPVISITHTTEYHRAMKFSSVSALKDHLGARYRDYDCVPYRETKTLEALGHVSWDVVNNL